jgi:L-amino acid N-acyltransferase YncA
MTASPQPGSQPEPQPRSPMASEPGHDVTIVPLTVEHWLAVERIYAAGIATGHATFESATPSWAAFDSGKLPGQRLVALDDAGSVLGWAAASGVSDRCVYAGVVEHSVYVDPAVSGRGIGLTLLKALIASTEAAGIWTIQSGVFPENIASLRLHRRAGFRTVGVRERVGKMTYGPLAGRWRDVVSLERRSHTVG